MELSPTFTAEQVRAFEPDSKVGLLATVDPEGRPHLSLITTLMANGPGQLVWGQFCEGRSKSNVRANPRVGFLVMTLDRRVWRGRARWTHEAKAGPEFERYNHRPMFRYNAYFGIHTVHFMDLLGCGAAERLSLPALLAGHGLAAAGLPALRRRGRQEPVLKPWARGLMNRLDTLKFVAHLDADGEPRIVPLVPCLAADSGRLVLAAGGRQSELAEIPAGAEVALLALNLKLESVLVRGAFSGLRGPPLARLAHVDLHWVYNSMPPQPGQIYPPQPLKPVREF